MTSIIGEKQSAVSNGNLVKVQHHHHFQCHHNFLQEKDSSNNSAANSNNVVSDNNHSVVVVGRHSMSISLADLKPFQYQLSGHSIIYKLDNNKIAKPSNYHEIEVYKVLQKHHSFTPFIATFHGIVDSPNCMPVELQTTKRNLGRPYVNPLRKQKVFIILEDLTANYRNPSLMDLKLGRILWEATANPDKINRLRRKAFETTSHSHGVRVDGMRVFCAVTQETRIYKRDFTWKRSIEELLRIFLFNGKETRYDVISSLLEKLIQLRDCLEKHRRSFNFLQSSLLLIYDSPSSSAAGNDPDSKHSLSPSSSPTVNTSVKIIDFDHAHTIFTQFNGKKDEDIGDAGCIFGIETLISLLDKMQKSTSFDNNVIIERIQEKDNNLSSASTSNSNGGAHLSVAHSGHSRNKSDSSNSSNSGSDSSSEISVSTS
jgi:hypothetical protein